MILFIICVAAFFGLFSKAFSFLTRPSAQDEACRRILAYYEKQNRTDPLADLLSDINAMPIKTTMPITELDTSRN